MCTIIEEEWRDIAGYEGLYQVSNLGRVKSLNYHRSGKEQILNPGKTGKNRGYLQVALCKNGNECRYKVHRLVADAFIQNTDNLPEVNHKDENTYNNRVDNLEWISHKDNINYGTRTRRTSSLVMCIETGTVYPSLMEASRKTGVRPANICNCCQGKRKTTGGYHWKYANC